MANEAPASLSVSQWLGLLSEDGQRQIVEFVAYARETRGAGWIDELTAEYPMASWIVALVSTRTADEALEDICCQFPNLPVRLLGGKIKSLHARLAAEIDKPRG